MEDTQNLGELAEGIILFVEDIPSDLLVGPNEGYIQINFSSALGQMTSLWFQTSTGRDALDEGLKGTELFNRLLNR